MTMLSEDTSRCPVCQRDIFMFQRWLAGDDWLGFSLSMDRLCSLHSENLKTAQELARSAHAMLQHAWNLDPTNKQLAQLMQQLGVKSDPSLPPFVQRTSLGEDILPKQSRLEMDKLADSGTRPSLS
jgi:hypothetical protein